MNRDIRGFLFYAAILLLLFGSIFRLGKNMTNGEHITQTQYYQYLKEGEIAEAQIYQNKQVPTGNVILTLKDGSAAQIHVSDVKAAEEELISGKVVVTVNDVERDNIFLTSILPVILMGGFMLLFFMLTTRGAGGGSKMMNFGKSRATLLMPGEKSKTFKDVAGLQEEKEDLDEMVDFLRDPRKYTKMGARIPKGYVLVGPPGTGKTLLAKAVAGEAGVPFFSISGSDFVEMYVGVGASRVRDLFEEAKKNAPCIVFIDEIDAVARRRGTGMGGGHDEREQTLNQLLVEMDGFAANEGIIVMAATNRVDILDPAILRPGRFDRRITVNRPDVKGREEILKVHCKEKPLGDDVNLGNVAKVSSGFTGADLENLMNEAAIMAAKQQKGYISQVDIDHAFVKLGIGTEKRSRVISEEDKRLTAYHEAGHAILYHVLPHVGPVHTISIIPNSCGAGGYTMPFPEADHSYMTKGRMLDELIVSYGGRVAEELVLKDISTGASGDIKQATSIARDMVTKYGMSEKIGLIDYSNDDDEVFIGRDLAHTKSYSDSMGSAIDEEVKRILDEAHENARKILIENMDVLHACAALLLEREKIGQEEFEALFGENV